MRAPIRAPSSYPFVLTLFVDLLRSSSSPRRPIKMGKTFTLPPGLTEDGEEESIDNSVSLNTSASVDKRLCRGGDQEEEGGEEEKEQGRELVREGQEEGHQGI